MSIIVKSRKSIQRENLDVVEMSPKKLTCETIPPLHSHIFSFLENLRFETLNQN